MSTVLLKYNGASTNESFSEGTVVSGHKYSIAGQPDQVVPVTVTPVLDGNGQPTKDGNGYPVVTVSSEATFSGITSGGTGTLQAVDAGGNPLGTALSVAFSVTASLPIPSDAAGLTATVTA